MLDWKQDTKKENLKKQTSCQKNPSKKEIKPKIINWSI